MVSRFFRPGFSSNDPEILYDIQWNPAEASFIYNDPHSCSPIIAAVINHDIDAIKSLLEKGQSVNINDNLGNTPLHIACIKHNKEVFDFLLTVEDIRLDAVNFDGQTPLIFAFSRRSREYEYFCIELINHGADLEIRDNNQKTALCHAVCLSETVSQHLINNGADVNAQDDMNSTPLILALEALRYDIAYMLIFHGAIVPHFNINGVSALNLAISRQYSNLPYPLAHLLINLTFDEHDLEDKQIFSVNAFHTLFSYPEVFDGDLLEIMYEHTSKLDCDSFFDVRVFSTTLETAPVERFIQFIDKFPEYLREYLVRRFDLISIFIKTIPESDAVIKFLYYLLDRSDFDLFLRVPQRQYPTIGILAERLKEGKVSLEKQLELILCLLSRGIQLSIVDLSMIYALYGSDNCLFKHLLLLPIEIDLQEVKQYYEGKLKILPILIINIYPIKLKDWICYDFIDYDEFELFFSGELKRIVDNYSGKSNTTSPCVPKLKELARNSSREYLIDRFKIKNSMQFYNMLRRLDIMQGLKDIISYRRRIYNCGQ